MRCNSSTAFFFIAVLLFLFLSEKPSAQSTLKPFYNFKTYTTEHGLLSNNVNCVHKDTRGFLWIGTDRGVQRFNGSSFLTFRHLNADSNTIANENVMSITEDKQHDIWIATRGGITKFSYSNGGLTNYRNGYKNGQLLGLGLVFCFFEDSKGRKWIGTVDAGLYLFDKAKQQFINFSPAPYLGMKKDRFQYVGAIQESQKQEIIFSVTNGFVIIDKEGKQEYITVPVPTDKKIVYLPCGLLPLLKEYPDEIWITSLFNGIFKYDRATQKWKHYYDEKEAIIMGRVINWGKDDWMCCYKFGAYIFNHRIGVFTKAFNNDKIEPVSEICRDNSGIIWLASNGSGLHLLNISSQLFSSRQYIRGWNFDRIIYCDSSLHTIYSVNPDNTSGIISFNKATNKISNSNIPGAVKFHKVINNFIADHNILYMARWGGMCKYNLSTYKFDSIVYKYGSFNSQQDNFFDVCRSPAKIYFAGGGSESPYMYDKATHMVKGLALLPSRYTAKKYFSNSLCFNNGNLYTGISYGDSIFCYNEASGKKFSIAVPAAYMKGNPDMIQSLCVDKNQNLWCGTGVNGIYVYSIPSKKWIKHISQQEGSFFSSASQLLCDEDGNVWCNGSAGLYLFNPNNFLFKNFTGSDGLAAEMSGGYLTLLPNHQLAYNNIKGDDVSFGIINTKPADTAVQTISISITNLKILGNIFLADTLLDNVLQLTLPPNQNTFSLNYAGVDITEAKNVLYSYMLEGAEKFWHEVGGEQNLSYLNLTPGSYVLHIKCKSRNGKIVSKERLLYITLLPAWYQTWWFKVLVILACSFVLFIAIRYYLRQQLKKQQVILEKERALTEERNRIAADMHDDVGAGLSRIRYITASLKNLQGNNEAEIAKIVSLSDESVEKMNEIIWSLHQGSQQLEELLSYTRSQCSEMVSNAGMSFTFDLPENIPTQALDWKYCRNIYLVVKEAVNNAIKHSGATHITITCDMTEQLHLSITDNGRGFDPNTIKNNGNGLHNFKKRIDELGGTQQLHTAPGHGTVLQLNIPLKHRSAT